MVGGGTRPPALVMVGDVPEPVGGVAEVCVQVCERLHDAGVRVAFIDTEVSPVKRPPTLASYAMFRPTVTAAARVLRSPRAVTELLRVVPGAVRGLGVKRTAYVLMLTADIVRTIGRTGASLVLAHHAGVRGLAAVLAARATQTRAAVMVHGAEFTHPGWNQAKPVARYVVEAADLVVTPSMYTRSLCARATARAAADIHVAYNGVDHERFNAAVARPSTPRDEHVVLFLGHLHTRKGPTILAEAIPLMTAARPTRYVFVGPDMGEEGVLRQVVEASGVADRVHIQGQVEADDLPGLYASADVFVFPTAWPTEGFGLVAAEAMACGTPVVASRIGAIPEIVKDGVTGLLFEPGDPQDLADKLSRLLDDDELRARMGAEGVRDVARFTWDSLTSLLVAHVSDT